MKCFVENGKKFKNVGIIFLKIHRPIIKKNETIPEVGMQSALKIGISFFGLK